MNNMCKKCLIVVLILIVFVGCSRRVYQKPIVRNIGTEKEKVTTGRVDLKINPTYNKQDDSIIADITITESELYKIFRKKEYEECWKVEHGNNIIANLIELPFAIIANLIELPFAIIEAVLGMGEKPGCTTYTKVDKKRKVSSRGIIEYPTEKWFTGSSNKYNGEVKFEAMDDNINLKPSSTRSVNGIAKTKLVFEYPFLSPLSCSKFYKNFSDAMVIIKVPQYKVTKPVLVQFCDTSPHLRNLFKNYFSFFKVVVLDINTRYPITNAIVTIDISHNIDLDAYVNSLPLSDIEKNYLKIFIKNEYSRWLLPNGYNVFKGSTDNEGQITILLPNNISTFEKVLTTHKEYRYREMFNVVWDSNTIKNPHLEVLLDDVGSKIRKEEVFRPY